MTWNSKPGTVKGWSKAWTIGGGRAGGGVVDVLAEKRRGELVAADAGEDGAGRQRRLQARGHALDQFVAAVVADRVVDRLEAVDVDIDHRQSRRPRSPA